MISVIIPSIRDDVNIDFSNQTFRDFEVIIEKDTQRKGAAYTRNQAIKKAKGELLAFTDDDCQPKDDWLEVLYNTYNEKKCCIAGKTIVPDGSTMFNRVMISRGFRAKWYEDDGFHCGGATCNLLIPRCVLEDVGLFDERFKKSGWEDSDITLRILKAGYKIWYAPEAAIIHRERPEKECKEKFGLSYGSLRNSLLFKIKHWDIYLFGCVLDEKGYLKRRKKKGHDNHGFRQRPI